MTTPKLETISEDAKKILQDTLNESLEPVIKNITEKVNSELSKVTDEHKETIKNIEKKLDEQIKELKQQRRIIYRISIGLFFVVIVIGIFAILK